MPQLTREQRAVVDSRAALLAVDAFAGSGKTSTLVEYARARPRARILYLAFNKSVAADARERFPDNVDCRTTHSLAYSVEGRKYSAKLANPRAYEVAQECRCNPRRAKAILTTLSAWLCSSDPKIAVSHVDPDSVEDEVDAAAVVDQAGTHRRRGEIVAILRFGIVWCDRWPHSRNECEHADEHSDASRHKCARARVRGSATA